MIKKRYSKKHLQTLALALRDDTQVMTLEGTVRSSKTVHAIDIFYNKVIASPENLHCLAAKDYDALRDNILDCNGFGLLSGLYPGVEIKREQIGGYFLTIPGLDGSTKRVLLVGYSNKEMWKKILGKTIATFLIDEVNIADKQFIDETFSRQASADSPLSIFTLNGDDPKHFIYQEYINYCKPLMKVPASILIDMNEKENKPGRYYTHWTFEDNPVMTPEKIERAKSIYPAGSYYYTIKVLGERGSAEGLIYSIFVENMEKHIVKDLTGYDIQKIIIGVDFGGHTSAHTFVATAYCNKMTSIIHIESEKIDASGVTPDQLNDKFELFVKKVQQKYKYFQLLDVYVDSAEQTIRNGMIYMSKARGLNVRINNALKRPILDRIDYQLQLFNLGMLKISTNASSCIEAYRTARWNTKEGHTNERLDNGSTDIDTMDASEYTLEPLMKDVLRFMEVQRR